MYIIILRRAKCFQLRIKILKATLCQILFYFIGHTKFIATITAPAISHNIARLFNASILHIKHLILLEVVVLRVVWKRIDCHATLPVVSKSGGHVTSGVCDWLGNIASETIFTRVTGSACTTSDDEPGQVPSTGFTHLTSLLYKFSCERTLNNNQLFNIRLLLHQRISSTLGLLKLP